MLLRRALLQPIAHRILAVSRFSRVSPMAHWSTTCLSSESSDTNLSLLVDCNASRYLFNCGEGTTRTLLQRKKGFRKFKAIFTSGIDTDRSSGLPGLLMTIADSGATKADVFGPLGLDHYLASTRLYTMRESLSLKTHEIQTTSTSPVYTDENLSVFALPISPEDDVSSANPSPHDSLKRKRVSDCTTPPPSSKREKLSVDANTLPGDESSARTMHPAMWDTHAIRPLDLTGEKAAFWRHLVVQHIFPGKPANASKGIITTISEPTSLAAQEHFGRKDAATMVQLNKRLPRMTREHYAVSYVVLGALGRGKFDAAKATALGLKNGPLRGRLAKGETIVTTEGKTITPDMVLGPPPRPEAMIFVDCPSPDYITGLARSEAITKFQQGGEYPLHCMFHLAGPKVLDDARYHQWLATFGDRVHHLVAGPDVTPDRITFTSSAYAQLRLSHLDSEIFQIPKHSPPPTGQFGKGLKTELLKHNHIVTMKPAKPPVLPPDDDGIDLFHPAIQKGGEHNILSLLKPKTIEVFNGIRQLVANEARQRKPQPGDNVTVTPLGTSSAMPSKYRNVSSLIIRIPGSGSILLDCGEGTLGQLRRHFGEAAPSILRDLKCVFISHIHGDHHMGLSKLLSQRRKLDPPCTSPVYLITNQATFMYLQEYNDLEDLGLDDASTGVRVIYSEYAHWRQRSGLVTDISSDTTEEWKQVQSSQIAIRDLTSALDLASIATVDVWHRGRCYGLVVKHREGWSIVYSGDTRPTDNLIRAGRNATLLIHEATLGDDQAEIAAVKAHSTIGQAIDVARRMQAKNVLLTHFSNRFPKTPQMTTGPAEATDPTIAIAFDHATVSIGNMWKLNRYLPAVEQSFIDSEDPEDEVVQAGEAS